MDRALWGVGKEAIRLLLDDGETLATQLLESGSVEHRDMSAAVFDHAVLVQAAAASVTVDGGEYPRIVGR